MICDIKDKVLSSLLISIALLVLYGFTAFSIPAGAGCDEPMHVSRVYQLSQGVMMPQRVKRTDLDLSAPHLILPTHDDCDSYGGEVDVALCEQANNGNLAFYGSKDRPVFDFPIWENKELNTDFRVGDCSSTFVFSNTAINSPLCYIPQVLCFKLASLFTADPLILILAMRIGGILALVFTLFACMLILPFGAALLPFIALLPHSVGTFSSVTADTVTFLSLALYISILMRLLFIGHSSVKWADWILLGVSLFTVCVCKVAYAPFGLLLFLLPLCSEAYRDKQSLFIVLLIGLAALVGLGFWCVTIKDINTGVMWRETIDPDAQKSFILQDPLNFIRIVLLSLFKNDFLAIGSGLFSPFNGWHLVLSAFVFLLLSAKFLSWCFVKISTRRAVFAFLVGATIISLFAIHLALYLKFTDPGMSEVMGVQPRYFIPLLLPVYLSLLVALAFPKQEMAREDSAQVLKANTMSRLEIGWLLFLVLVDITIIYLALFAA